MVQQAQYEMYEREGFVLLRQLFSAREVEILREALAESERIKAGARDRLDAAGLQSRISLWTGVSEDVFGAVSTSPRMVGAAEALLSEPVYHWHSKVTMKQPQVGGAWEWHQDYGYWYYDGVPFPKMISAMLSLDAANRENGCLKVMVGSHRLGRLEHVTRGTQSGADPERLAALAPLFATRYVESEPGDVLFFHCNLLHGSEANVSGRTRNAYICCYNALSNKPVIGEGHGKPVPITLSPDDAILRAASRAL